MERLGNSTIRTQLKAESHFGTLSEVPCELELTRSSVGVLRFALHSGLTASVKKQRFLH